MTHTAQAPKDAPLSTIVVLYRESETLTLWGIPYAMRPGQSPRNLKQGDELRREVDAYHLRHGLVTTAFKPSTAHWIYLGSPGWFGSLGEERIKEVKAFLAQHHQDLPNWPEEWVDLRSPVEPSVSVQEAV